MREMSTLCSAAIFRTSGVDFVRRRCSAVCTPPPSPSAGRPDGRTAGAAAAFAGSGLGTGGAEGGGAAAFGGSSFAGAGGRCRDFGIDLVGRDLEQRLVPLDGVADLLEPFAQRAFGDGLAHLGHEYVYACHWISVSTPPTSGRLSRCLPSAATQSPRASAHTAAARRA